MLEHTYHCCESATAVLTKAVVAICVVFVPAVAVGAVGVPVRAGEFNGAEAYVPPIQ